MSFFVQQKKKKIPKVNSELYQLADISIEERRAKALPSPSFMAAIYFG